MILNSLFDRYLRAEESLFRNQYALDPEFLPSKLPHRQGQIQRIASCIEPILRGNRPRNVFIHGPTGVGKTAVAKHILEELPKVTDRTRPIYINCWNHNTRYSILRKILRELKVMVPSRGKAPSELYERLEKYLELRKKNLVIGFDEVDQIGTPKKQKVIYELLRLQEKPIGLILISNDPYALTYLDQRIRSSLHPEEIEFKPYTQGEVFDILNQRRKAGFVPGVMNELFVQKISRFVYQYGGDIRLGLQALREAGRLAERDALRKVKEKHVDLALDQIRQEKLVEKVKELKEKKERAYEILKVIADLTVKREVVYTGRIRDWFKERRQKISRNTLNYGIRELEAAGLIETEKKQINGRTRLIKLKIPTDTVISY